MLVSGHRSGPVKVAITLRVILVVYRFTDVSVSLHKTNYIRDYPYMIAMARCIWQELGAAAAVQVVRLSRPMTRTRRRV